MRYAFRDSVPRFPLARSVPSGRWCAKSCWVGPGEGDLMSKAFVKETDDEDDLPDEPLAIPAGVKNYMTPEGHRRMQEELRQLLRVERPKVVETVAWAAGNGDRCENGDYIYGKRRLREIDRRIRFLSKRLESAQIVDPNQQKKRDQIFFGATVTCVSERGSEMTITIVGIDEADPDRGRGRLEKVCKRLLAGAKEIRTAGPPPTAKEDWPLESIVYPEGDRGFESPSLQQRVRCEPDPRERIPPVACRVTSWRCLLSSPRGRRGSGRRVQLTRVEFRDYKKSSAAAQEFFGTRILESKGKPLATGIVCCRLAI